MWSYKFTSSASVFVDQCRVGVRFEAATPTSQLLALFDAVSKEQVCEKTNSNNSSSVLLHFHHSLYLCDVLSSTYLGLDYILIIV